MKEKIINELKFQNKALEIIDIYNLLNLNEIDELNILKDTLDDMELNGEIFKTNKGKFILFENCPGVYCGKLQRLWF